MIGNYTTKTIEEWEIFLETHDKALGLETRESFEGVIGSLEQSVHWVIGPTALELVRRTEIQEETLANTKLPYDYMVIEYNAGHDHAPITRTEVSDTPDPVLHATANKRVILLMNLEGMDRFALISIYCQPEIQSTQNVPISWMISPVAIAFPYTCFENVSAWYHPEDNRMYSIEFGNENCPTVIPSTPMFESFFASGKVTPKQIEEPLRDILEEVKMALGLLSILGCDNVPVETVPAPAKLNKKRAKQGKAALPAYRTLHLSDHTSRQVCNNCTPGGHASPRAHWRRGHIRNQPTAKGVVRKWIKPTIVGAGVPDKPEIIIT